MSKNIVLSIFIILIMSSSVFGFDCQKCDKPFGYYCRGPRGGWYGEKRRVTKEEEAKRLIKEFFCNKEVIINKIIDKKLFYEIDINVADKGTFTIIIDKRNGRMRTID